MTTVGGLNDLEDLGQVVPADLELFHVFDWPRYIATMMAQQVIALQTELHRPKPL
jgi:hypothetical protein